MSVKSWKLRHLLKMIRSWVVVKLLLVWRKISGAGYGKRKSGSVRVKKIGLIIIFSSYSILYLVLEK
ncbi:protein of unknown function [Tepidibacter aestuarii]|nr:protein of unknown function [Tepidibacter aestuarii]